MRLGAFGSAGHGNGTEAAQATGMDAFLAKVQHLILWG